MFLWAEKQRKVIEIIRWPAYLLASFIAGFSMYAPNWAAAPACKVNPKIICFPGFQVHDDLKEQYNTCRQKRASFIAGFSMYAPNWAANDRMHGSAYYVSVYNM